MECDLGNHYKKTRPMRRTYTISLESIVYDGEALSMAEVISDGDRMMERLNASFLWDEIESILPQNQTAVLRMQADGYSPREIAAAKKKPLRDIEDMLESAAESVRMLCLV
jgi:DNA-directed RNA polymerase specialized sigma24 family protein